MLIIGVEIDVAEDLVDFEPCRLEQFLELAAGIQALFDSAGLDDSIDDPREGAPEALGPVIPDDLLANAAFFSDGVVEACISAQIGGAVVLGDEKSAPFSQGTGESA